MRTYLSIALISIACAGCGGKKDDAPAKEQKAPDKADKADKAPAKDPAEKTAAPADKAAPEATDKPVDPGPVALSADKSAAEPAPAGGLVDIDLSSLGEAWAGWTVKGPEDSKAAPNENLIEGGVEIRWGNGAGAMGFAQKKVDFKAIKKDYKVTGDTKVTAETADRLDATMTMMGTELKGFHRIMKVGDATVSCWTVSFVSDDAALEQADAICDSLAKQ